MLSPVSCLWTVGFPGVLARQRDLHSVVSRHRLFFLSQAEDLVANFFPKKLLELDGFLKVRYMFSSVSFFIFKLGVEREVAGLILCIFLCISPCYKSLKRWLVACMHLSAVSSRGGASFFGFLCVSTTFIFLTYSATLGCPSRCCGLTGTPALQTADSFDHSLELARCSWVEGGLVTGLLLDFFFISSLFYGWIRGSSEPFVFSLCLVRQNLLLHN